MYRTHESIRLGLVTTGAILRIVTMVIALVAAASCSVTLTLPPSSSPGSVTGSPANASSAPVVANPLVGSWTVGTDCSTTGIQGHRTIKFADAGIMYLDGQGGSWMEVDAEHIRLDLQNGRPPGLYYYQVTGDNLSLANADPYGNPCVARRS